MATLLPSHPRPETLRDVNGGGTDRPHMPVTHGDGLSNGSNQTSSLFDSNGSSSILDAVPLTSPTESRHQSPAEPREPREPREPPEPSEPARIHVSSAANDQSGYQPDEPHSASNGDGTVVDAKPQSLKTSDTLSTRDKLGIWSITVFSIGPVFILGAMGVLAFLWFADGSNQTWRKIMVRNWLTKAVAICSEVIKQAINFQLALMVSMMAAIALERSDTLLRYIASFSTMRATAGSGTVLIMAWYYLVASWRTRFRWSLIFFLSILLALVFGLTQLISILLLSDLDLRTVAGDTHAANTPFAFANHYDSACSGPGCAPTVDIIERGGTWYRKAPAYPTFAEYSASPYEADGVSDTGPTLRAFLPFQTAQERESLMTYSGPTTVLDARTTCQIPEFSSEKVQVISGAENFLLFQGHVEASRSTPRLGNATLSFGGSSFYLFNQSAAFSCLAPLPSDLGNATSDSTEWRLALCQLGEGQGGSAGTIAGGLVSEFHDISTWWSLTTNRITMQDTSNYGTAYLMLNVTTGSQQSWQAVVEDETFGGGYSPPAVSERDEWLDLVYNAGKLVLSTTLCYSAFGFASLPVEIVSQANRTEPSSTFNSVTGKYEFKQVRTLLGQRPGLSPLDRGTLHLNEQSWIANTYEAAPNLEPYMRTFADLAQGSPGYLFGSGNYGNISGILYSSATCPSSSILKPTNSQLAVTCVVPEDMHIWLVQEILRTGGSMAFALQSMITLLSSMAYYDQMGQFDNTTSVQRTFFVVATVPVTPRGFIIVAATIAVFLALGMLVLLIFLRGTHFSRIGASWIALSQALAGDAEVYIKESGLDSDQQVEDMMAQHGIKNARAGLQEVGGKVVVVASTSAGMHERKSI